MNENVRLYMDYLPGEIRAAFVRGEQLEKLLIHRPFSKSILNAQTGDIYVGRIGKINKKLKAAFVNIGESRDGFLPLKDQDPLTEGQYLLVQVKHPARAEKGAFLTQTLELHGPDVILTPNRKGLNVSKNIKDRARLKTALSEFFPQEIGLVVRSSADDKPVDRLKDQIQGLLDEHNEMVKPPLCKPEKRYQADHFSTKLGTLVDHYDVCEIIIDDPALAHFLPDLSKIIHKTGMPLFEAVGLEEQIEALSNQHVPIKGGGALYIERTKALIAIDVDMGNRDTSALGEDQIFELNVAALDTLKEQISLRGLGGQIVIDFVKMKNKKHQNKLAALMVEIFSKEPEITAHGLSRLGLGELSIPHLETPLDIILGDPASKFYHTCRRIKFKSLSGPVEHPFMDDIPYDDALQKTTRWLENQKGFKPLFKTVKKD